MMAASKINSKRPCLGAEVFTTLVVLVMLWFIVPDP